MVTTCMACGLALIASHSNLRVYCGMGAWSPMRDGMCTRKALRQRSASSLPRSLRTVGTILRRDADTTTRTSASSVCGKCQLEVERGV